MRDSNAELVRRQEPLGLSLWSAADVGLGAALGQEVIERDIRPRVVTDKNAQVLWTSRSANRLLRAPLPIFIHDGQLCFEDGQAARDGEAFLGTLGAQRRRHFVAAREGDCWVLVSGWAQETEDQRLLLLTFSLSQPTMDSVSSGLASHFGLTKAEAAVLDELARLRSPTEISQQLGVTLHTVRSHLKRIHAKMSVNSNIRLLQIVRAFCDS